MTENSDSTLLLLHQGLGDMIIVNALVRAAVEAYGQVTIPVKESNLKSVQFMYKDLEPGRLTLHPMPDSVHRGGEKALFELARNWPGPCTQNLTMFNRRTGDEWIATKTRKFDENFYRWAGLPIEQKFSGFRCDRDESIEADPPEGDYAFVHDAPQFAIPITKLPRGKLPIYHADDFDLPNIWSYWAIIEEATEIHVANSSFLNMIDFLDPRGRIVWHRYARDEVSYPTLRLDWEILD